MKVTSKNRQTTMPAINPEMTTPRVATITIEAEEPRQDPPEVRHAWVRLYEAIVGKRRVNRQRGLAHQH